MIKTYFYPYPTNYDLFDRAKVPKCIEENKCIAIYNGDLKLGNYNIYGQYYHVHYAPKIGEHRYMFVTPYVLNDNPEMETENRNNAVCPVCGKVDYDSWEWSSGKEWTCGLCGSHFILYHKYITEYDGDMEMYTKLVLQKINKPKRLRKDKIYVY